MKLQESGENYLETILILKNKQGFVRAIDVANELGFSKPSISRAMGILKEAEYITIQPDGNIILTPEGYAKASAVYDRHVFISKYLVKILGVDEKTADKDACRIEHIISEETFLKIKESVKKAEEK
ncbi:MAG: metal-dependent transcriptional regulator [Firmicutes bacterium]|nr:metal-dependent transcriptional regulator [Bacillota bacterium]